VQEIQGIRFAVASTIDGEKLVEMFKRFELGLKPVASYEIDKSFFDEFKT
jgi:hypothetical protein